MEGQARGTEGRHGGLPLRAPSLMVIDTLMVIGRGNPPWLPSVIYMQSPWEHRQGNRL